MERLEPRTLLDASPSLVADINLYTASSMPHSFTPAGDVGYFFAGDTAHGSELWKTDGTAAGTVFVKDIRPGTLGSAISMPPGAKRTATLPGGIFVFVADDGVHGSELWRSDGTEAGTVMVKEIRPGPGPAAAPVGLAAAGGLVYFVDDDGGGSTVWRTDGTEAGTFELGLPATASSLSPFSDFAVTRDGTVFFTNKTDAASPAELWKTDGSVTGTARVPGVESVAGLTALGNLVFFRSAAAGTPPSLWRTDGTEGGTVLLKALSQATGSSLGSFAALGERLFFLSKDGTGPAELWQTDGTPAGTRLVKSFGDGASAFRLGQTGGKLFFTVQASGATASTLWSSDGTAAGTIPLREIPSVSDMVLTGGRAFIRSNLNLWLCDGTVPGTVLLKEIGPLGGGGGFSSPSGPFMTAAGEGKVVVGTTVDRLTQTPRMWASDGTVDGTVKLGDIGVWAWEDPNVSPPLFNPYYPFITVLGDRLMFPAHNRQASVEVWSTDGTPAGTGVLKDANTATLGSSPGGLTPLGGKVVFNALDGERFSVWGAGGDAAGATRLVGPDVASLGGSQFARLGDRLYFTRSAGRELWSTDGTAEGTSLVQSFDTGISGLKALRGGLYFRRADPAHGNEPWVSDGTPGGARLLKDANPGADGSMDGTAPTFVEMDGAVYFDALPGGGRTSRDLWRTDGTEAGTVRVDLGAAPTPLRDAPLVLTPSGDALFFLARNPSNQLDLWKTDGTAAGTARLAQVLVNNVDKARLTAGPAGTVFFDNVDFTGMQLWKSDGTAAGTARVKTIPRPGAGRDVDPLDLTLLGDTLYFTASDAEHGRELWKSDGTEAGTVLVRDVNPGPDSSIPPGLGYVWAAGGSVYFAANDGAAGVELWKTDGTEAGTARLGDINAGTASSNPAGVVAADDGTVYFFADDGTHGRELWKLPPQVALVTAVVGRHVFYNHSPFGEEIAPDKVALLPGQPLTFSNVISYSRGINGVIIDVFPAVVRPLTADDFTFEFAGAPDPTHWAPAPAPELIELRLSPIPELPARIVLTWPDGAIQNGWLRVTVKANEHTGVLADDVFTFGNLVGETGDGIAPAWRVNALDLAAVRRALNAAGTLATPTDFNRDGRTNALDLAIVKRSLNQPLPPPPAPAASNGPDETTSLAKQLGL